MSFFYENDGPAAAIRALETDILPVEELGWPNQIWRDIVNRQQGLVLVTGITGAGKSTTIASIMDRISRQRACRIITLEDPIEYRLTSRNAVISQREVGREVPSYERGPAATASARTRTSSSSAKCATASPPLGR